MVRTLLELLLALAAGLPLGLALVGLPPLALVGLLLRGLSLGL